MINTISIRIALGLPRWTPNLVLHKHTGFPPTEMRIKDWAFQFWIKHASLGSWSPFASFLSPSDVEEETASVLPQYVDKYLDDRNCCLGGLSSFHFPNQLFSGVVSFLLFDLPLQHTDLSEQVVSTLFLNFCIHRNISWKLLRRMPQRIWIKLR